MISLTTDIRKPKTPFRPIKVFSQPITLGKRVIILTEDTLEKDFQEVLIAEAKQKGWLVYHAFDSRRSTSGFPDLVLARNGIVHHWELKVQGKKPNRTQVEWIVALKARWWWPSQYEEMIRILE